jgi:DNA-binding transcriptional regulator YiaG
MECGQRRARRGAATKQEILKERGERLRQEDTVMDERIRRMRDEDGLTVDVIQRRTGKSKQAVYNALERARKKRSGVHGPKPEVDGPGREVQPAALGTTVHRGGSINLAWDEL